jgi:hypothetical protein
MAKPRVFISSTYYDLKHLRSSLDRFVESLGFEPVLSEKGDIAFSPNTPLDESCYREAANADIFVLLVGGRYGSEASGQQKTPNRTFFERYESITKKEYESAFTRDIPLYVLVENNVYSEYQTYLQNKGNRNIAYAHVDSVNVFRMIEEILSKPRNNPTHTFERFSDIESWLCEQWAGLFRELLQKQTQQRQLSALGGQVTELKAINETLRKYLEAVMTGITPADSKPLIESERRRLQEFERNERVKNSTWSDYCMRQGVQFEVFLDAITKATSYSDFAKKISFVPRLKHVGEDLLDTLLHSENARSDYNAVRNILSLKAIRLRREESSKTSGKNTKMETTEK